MGEKIAFGFIGILVLTAIGLCFFINLYLGFFVLVFSAGIFWWIYRVRKRRIDRAMAYLAQQTGLSFNKNFFKYGTVTGNYKGFEVEIGVYSDLNAFGGIGILMASLTGEGVLAALEIRNFTGIKIKLPSEIQEKRLISEDFPLIITNKDELYLMLPYVSSNEREIKRHLDSLCETASHITNSGFPSQR
ncbi:MAG: hypothetical protein J7L62_04570 [Candidatus Aminicenantes bacterium]|nr:hypothetical protein [Candidatus Aminicenantes bacterium]